MAFRSLTNATASLPLCSTGALGVHLCSALLPYGLAFAAGAMIFVVSVRGWASDRTSVDEKR